MRFSCQKMILWILNIPAYLYFIVVMKSRILYHQTGWIGAGRWRGTKLGKKLRKFIIWPVVPIYKIPISWKLLLTLMRFDLSPFCTFWSGNTTENKVMDFYEANSWKTYSTKRVLNKAVIIDSSDPKLSES